MPSSLPESGKQLCWQSDSPQFQLSGVPVLNIYEPEEKLVKSLLKLHQHAHHNGYPVKDMPPDCHAGGTSGNLICP